MSSIVGYVLGILHGADYSGWEGPAATLGIVDLPRFVRVAYIHNASYVGGLVGLITTIIYLRKLEAPNQAASGNGAMAHQSGTGSPGRAVPEQHRST